MTLRTVVTAALLGGAVFLVGCNDTNIPPAPPPPPVAPPVTPPTPMSSISRFVASLIAMVTGASCETALPASLDASAITLTDDMDAQDANTLAVNCAG